MRSPNDGRRIDLSNHNSGTLPLLTNESRNEPLGNRQIRLDNRSNEGVDLDFRRDGEKEISLYRNENEHPESENIQGILKHGGSKDNE